MMWVARIQSVEGENITKDWPSSWQSKFCQQKAFGLHLQHRIFLGVQPASPPCRFWTGQAFLIMWANFLIQISYSMCAHPIGSVSLENLGKHEALHETSFHQREALAQDWNVGLRQRRGRQARIVLVRTQQKPGPPAPQVQRQAAFWWWQNHSPLAADFCGMTLGNSA